MPEDYSKNLIGITRIGSSVASGEFTSHFGPQDTRILQLLASYPKGEASVSELFADVQDIYPEARPQNLENWLRAAYRSGYIHPGRERSWGRDFFEADPHRKYYQPDSTLVLARGPTLFGGMPTVRPSKMLTELPALEVDTTDISLDKELR